MNEKQQSKQTDPAIYEEVKDTARDILYQLRLGKMDSQDAQVELLAIQVAVLADIAERLSAIEAFLPDLTND